MSASSKALLIVLCLLGWFALIGQFFLLIENRTSTVTEAVVTYFSFFTIQTNLLVALYSTLTSLFPRSRAGRFFSQPSVATAVAVYIAVVGLTYNLVLRFLWAPQGMQRVVDELLHLVIPVLFLAYWFVFVSKKELTWKSFYPWLIYPFFYCVYLLVRGAISGLYPYPFMDVNQLGYPQVFLNSLFVTIAFLGFSLLFIGIGKIKKG